MKGLYVLCVILLIAVVYGANSNDYCKYTNLQGKKFDLHLLAKHYVNDLEYYDPVTQGSVYFTACGSLSNITGCPENSSVCYFDSNGKSINYGSTLNVQTADVILPVTSTNTYRSGALEMMFGNGELCNNGVARKAVISYICNMDMSDEAYSYPNITGTVDACLISLTVETPFACPVANYCRSITNKDKCKTNDPICTWSYGACSANSGCFGGMSSVHAGILSFLIVVTAGLCLLCVCGLCLCACRKAKKSCPKKAAKKSSKSKKSRSAQKPKPETTFDSFEMPYQLVPGGSQSFEQNSNL